MLKNYFKIAVRNLARNKAFTFINIFGLAAGLATSLLIMLYIFDESRYDKHHASGDRLFRIASKSGKGETWAAGPAPLAGGLKAELPEVEQATRILTFPDILDNDFQRNYEKEHQTSTVIIYFTFIAILIACLGLFGLAAFSAEQRTKEVGIRKVLGASVTNFTTLLSRDVIRLVILAIVIALPLGWWVMNNWLSEFAYRISISWWMFALAASVSIVIAIMTVSFQAIRSAIINPVKSLRTE